MRSFWKKSQTLKFRRKETQNKMQTMHLAPQRHKHSASWQVPQGKSLWEGVQQEPKNFQRFR